MSDPTRDAEQAVREAREHYLNVRMHADICADVQATCEETEGVDAETLQTARNNALFAEAQAHEALDALCTAVRAQAFAEVRDMIAADEAIPNPLRGRLLRILDALSSEGK